MNDDVSRRVLISDISAKPTSIEEFNYSAEPYLKINTSTLGDYFKDYLITGIYEIQNYITRNFSFVTSSFDVDSYNELLNSLNDGADESEIEAIENYTFLINGYNYKLKKIEGDDNYYLLENYTLKKIRRLVVKKDYDFAMQTNLVVIDNNLDNSEAVEMYAVIAHALEEQRKLKNLEEEKRLANKNKILKEFKRCLKEYPDIMQELLKDL